MRDLHTPGSGRIQVDLHIAPRINDRAVSSTTKKIRTMGYPSGEELSDSHGVFFALSETVK
jgi:hypothetical protein